MNNKNKWQLCVAPMLGITDVHYRFFLRLLSKNTRLYTEMLHVNAVLNTNKIIKDFDFCPSQHPVALQLGGNNASMMYKAAKIIEKIGFDEINLNCGCPSYKVQHGLFGAILMKHTSVITDCIKSMMDAVNYIPITIKHRIGLDHNYSYDYLCDFVGKIYDTGCRIFIVHARNAILDKMSPKENRKIPPLNYCFVYKLKRDFPNATIVLNGGLNNVEQSILELSKLDGIMLGRAVVNNPRIISNIAKYIWEEDKLKSDIEVIQIMTEYMKREYYKTYNIKPIAKVLSKFISGIPGSKIWRKNLTNCSSHDYMVALDSWNELFEINKFIH
ncbi:tRNA-dihydrouridine(20/20a) synthase [Candidatus Kinetoplastibacterium sorsogonicusi]|uniref:tRNA-dihydrouridine synthase n=1 Tax=Candidatus Kinetoplastidibacterium kentomonadis TaxID=1576550 RepID=A0A3Q8ETJ3_9PROT|nr:tRNA dihydrouridine(20/20a) synthase DusA [Candidatus Kinetoplastibacterium sorsogonicusi]AWD32332.1 tRNA-dihydrouridine(20/20a) synthase [Candidatus Kinetoplastibacterium sorsogonicusi]